MYADCVSNDSSLIASVIVPVYNSADYLSACVESILSERAINFEVILVDDGSTDESPSICDSLAARDVRVRVIHKQNGGICSARNEGIKQAQGEYILFSDNDDRVLPGFVIENYEVARKYEADCVRFGRTLYQYSQAGKLLNKSNSVPSKLKIFGKADIAANPEGARFGSGGVWAGIYRRDFLIENQIVFDETFKSGFEDELFNDAVTRHACVYVWNPKIYYEWHRRASHSTSLKISANRLESLSKLLAYEYQALEISGYTNDNLKVFANRFFCLIKDCLLVPCYAKVSDKQQIYNYYEDCRELLLPYEEIMDYPCKKTRDTIAKSLLMSAHFNTLYFYLYATISLKNMLRKLEYALKGEGGFNK